MVENVSSLLHPSIINSLQTVKAVPSLNLYCSSIMKLPAHCLLIFSLTAATKAVNLNVTALTHRDDLSILQCWRLEPPFNIPKSGGGPIGAAVASLGTVGGKASFIIQGPGTVGGYKNAPTPQ